MQLGFETIGNATIVCFDGGPVLCTDPWITDNAYFGSWTHTHDIPQQQIDHIKACGFVWFSHGHPDHLNPESHPQFRGKQVLLADHVGGRIRDAMIAAGHNVRVLPDREWCELSENIKVLSIADFNQDSILLIDINGRLLVNLNDASDNGWGRTVRKITSGYSTSILLKLFGYGDADMMNYRDEAGALITPAAAQKAPLGKFVQNTMQTLGCELFIPFSSMHQYQRQDSVWANAYTTPFDALADGFELDRSRILPAFVRYDCADDSYTEIDPPLRVVEPLPPEHFGDNWTDGLDSGDLRKIEKYICSIEHLSGFLDFVNFRVGNKDHTVVLNKNVHKRGVTFEAPRHSLLMAVNYEIFDDLLIGNFMKTTLHGAWPPSRLYPHFSPYVAKYADNGLARTEQELAAYFQAYRKRAPLDALLNAFDRNAHSLAFKLIPKDTLLHRVAKKVYWSVKGAG